MQITVVLFLGFALILECSSQDITESETQYSTEGSSAGTQAIDWDTADPIVRTTVQNVGSRQYEQNTRTSPDYTTLFPNQWGPMMMRMMQPPYGTRITNAQDAREKTQNTRDYDPNPRRQKDNQVNFTQKVDRYPKPSDAVRNPMLAPYIPYSPYMFYPSQNPTEFSEDTRFSIPNNSANDVHPLTLQDLSEKLNISASTQDPYFYGLPNARLDDRLGPMPFPLVRYPPPGFFMRNIPDGRNPENMAPFAPYALPPYGFYPPLPNPGAAPTDDGSPQVYPQVDIFVRPPYFDRESGTESLAPEEIATRSDAIAALKAPEVPPSTPGPVDPVAAESVPRSPFPVNAYPFGFFPPGIAPPPLFPLPQGEIPPPTYPSRFIPNVPLPAVEPLPPRIPPVFPPPAPPATPVNLLPEYIPPPPVPVDLPPPKAPLNLPAPVPESGPVPEVAPPPGEVLTSDKELYEFGFDMNDGKGTDQHRQESKDEAGVVTGSYGYRDPFGVYRLVNYIADKNGYRAFIQSNEPGVANPGSADVVVMAERPPPQTVAESLKPAQPVVVEVPDDLIVQASETK